MTKLEIIFAVIGTFLSVVGIIVGFIGAKSLYSSSKNIIKNISDSSNLSINNIVSNGLSSRDLTVLNNDFVDELKKLYVSQAEVQKNNLIEVIKQTIISLKSENITNITPIEDDWQLKFFKHASASSNKNIQSMWSKLLKAKMTNKSTVSFRTMELISNLSPDEALLFERITDYVLEIDKDLVILNDYIHDIEKVDVQKYLVLVESGLIYANSLLSSNMEFINNEAHITNKNLVLVCSPRNKQKRIDFSIYALTRAGKEIYKSLGKEISNENLKMIAKYIRQKNPQYNISLHKVNSIMKEDIKYDAEDILDL